MVLKLGDGDCKLKVLDNPQGEVLNIINTVLVADITFRCMEMFSGWGGIR